ncbi:MULTISPECIES: hypothetical protein [unclassified Streptomyces]|uniref:hypothetical protein n=1 Tax=unclassified Streptomyces TaxID=2593676 RepID=UPI002252201E|nr:MULTISPECIES: hypothetical protein [unclassified Streptomyces]MCX4799489.1 hypothetical protein [Streptomyces sp. NBC_01242]WSJ40687.1 hypothetical protein OG772_35280 [Streptomyces sp. NBC_01321]WSP53158.1 hypothetical protein OG306_00970 [Streptomyces sp. NBC_01241]WSP67006.1 hypothetical protein OG466_38025 [Streptomyces sp. NBC_01240]
MSDEAFSRVTRRGVLLGGLAATAMGAAGTLAAAGPSSASPSAAAPTAGISPSTDPTRGPHKYFAFDTGIWNGHRGMANCRIEMGDFVKDEEHNPLFREGIFENPRLPWEPRFDNGYPNVFWDPEHKKFRCYYTLFLRDPASLDTPPEERRGRDYVIANRETGCCYAESTDGVHWTKPKLGLVSFDGSKDNNILFEHVQGTSVLYDPADPDPTRRYKLITLREADKASLCVAFSSDGIHFSDLKPWPANSPSPGADCHNLVFRDSRTSEYVLITRLWDSNIRVSAMSRSTDFINWSKPVEVHRGNGFDSQIYSMPVFEYGGLYLGLASLYRDGDTTLPYYDTVDLALQWSINLTEWNNVALDDSTLIPHGKGMEKYPRGDFDSSVIFSSVPVEIDDKLYFYYMGGKGRHTDWRESALGRGYIEKDKFACYGSRRGNQPSSITSQGFNFFGENVELLVDIEDGGRIEVDLMNQGGTVVQPGFEADNSTLRDLGNGWHRLTWRNSSVMTLNRESFYAMRITMRKAKLWAIQGDLYVRPLKYAKP